MSAIPLVAVTSSSDQLTAQDTSPEYYTGSQNGIGSDFMHLAMLLHVSLLAVCATTATNEAYGPHWPHYTFAHAIGRWQQRTFQNSCTLQVVVYSHLRVTCVVPEQTTLPGCSSGQPSSELVFGFCHHMPSLCCARHNA
jgi:hypothetical protein